MSSSCDTHTEQRSVALFDLDYTLISSDCTAHWLRFMLTRNWRRKLLTLCLMPLVKWADWRKWTLAQRNSVYLWAATAGLSRQRYLTLRWRAARYVIDDKGVQAYPEGLARLDWHRSQGHHVIIVTGALRWLARDICRALGIQYDVLLGSSDAKFYAGRISAEFCYAQNKVNLLNERGLIAHGADYAYSDSAADIPLLSVSRRRYVINPKPDCLIQFQDRFADSAQVLHWSRAQE
ncbi:HAD-IB family phosphatase [Alteromonas oceanisediminis]|uniref:HAD-IB family phosphatase n=1 Tax=Alteromonas oceanisediminis TaxID=2836180 RepID=UPI001BDA436D|nr:HAD-IB family phosphatase [Alteromonas oceanisediminis]MBT0585311.1 HAD-IB family phosphatase [Alteromonas oceanisediminis]